jgi:hypothetical protein
MKDARILAQSEASIRIFDRGRLERSKRHGHVSADGELADEAASVILFPQLIFGVPSAEAIFMLAA